MDFTFGFFQNLRSSCLNIQQYFDKLELKKIIQSKNLFQNAKIRSFFYKTNRTNNFFFSSFTLWFNQFLHTVFRSDVINKLSLFLKSWSESKYLVADTKVLTSFENFLWIRNQRNQLHLIPCRIRNCLKRNH